MELDGFESNNGRSVANEPNNCCKPNSHVSHLFNLTSRIYRKSSYVRVVGELHTYMAVNYFRADNVLAAPDPHEVYAHILGAIADTITYHCGAPVRVICLCCNLPF
jgi:hypothetical protein